MNDRVHIFFENSKLNRAYSSKNVQISIEDESFDSADYWFFSKKLDIKKGDKVFLATKKGSSKYSYPVIYARGWALSDTVDTGSAKLSISLQIEYIYDPIIFNPFTIDQVSESLCQKFVKKAVDTTLEGEEATQLTEAFDAWLLQNKKNFILRRYSPYAWTLYNETADRTFNVIMNTELSDREMLMENLMVAIEDNELILVSTFFKGDLLSDYDPDSIFKKILPKDYSLGYVVDFMEDKDLETMEDLVEYFKRIFFSIPTGNFLDVLDENDIDYYVMDQFDSDDDYEDQDGEWDDDDNLSLPPFLTGKRPQN